MHQSEPAKDQVEKSWTLLTGLPGSMKQQAPKGTQDLFQTTETYKWTSYNYNDSIKTDMKYSLAVKDNENIK